jgi:hypothetical protein
MATSAPKVGQAFDAETRKTFNAVFDAMSAWRDELAALTERNADVVFDRMSTAAKKVGWPEDLVDATRDQLQQASKLQLGMIDQITDAWQQQVKGPAAVTSPADFMKNFPQWPGMQAGGNPFAPGGFPNFGSLPAGNPMQFWMQAAEMWQKSWANAMQTWMQNTNGSGR